jgi:hypothetical protein
VDVILAVGFFLVAAVGSMTVIMSSMRLDSVNREGALARRAAETKIEEIKGTQFARILATYNANPADDPGGAGTAPGATFNVRGLNPQAGSAVVGQIAFPTIGTALREDAVLPGLGMPRDLNGDGVVDALDHAADYYVLPVLVSVRWRGASGDRSILLRTVVFP